MKMIVAILRDQDTESVSNALVAMGLSVTRIASTGGFLRQGKSTLLLGVEDDRVDKTIQVINDKCEPTIEPFLKRAMIFILRVEHFEEL
jgi:uncharacterized protein YaaQ